MTVYLLDTTIFSYLMRGDPVVQARIAGLSASDRVTICTTVRGEILYGIERLPQGARRRALETKAQQLFAAVAGEPVLATAGDQYARLKRSAEQAGTALDENDLWIAATAQSLGASSSRPTATTRACRPSRSRTGRAPPADSARLPDRPRRSVREGSPAT